jgi:hypothetical protein
MCGLGPAQIQGLPKDWRNKPCYRETGINNAISNFTFISMKPKSTALLILSSIISDSSPFPLLSLPKTSNPFRSLTPSTYFFAIFSRSANSPKSSVSSSVRGTRRGSRSKPSNLSCGEARLACARAYCR